MNRLKVLELRSTRLTCGQPTNSQILFYIPGKCHSRNMFSYVTPYRFAGFLESISELGKVESYPQLTQRAARVGYSVAKVVYRGYKASSQLQVG